LRSAEHFDDVRGECLSMSVAGLMASVGSD
jgi:hypothetical protein